MSGLLPSTRRPLWTFSVIPDTQKASIGIIPDLDPLHCIRQKLIPAPLSPRHYLSERRLEIVVAQRPCKDQVDGISVIEPGQLRFPKASEGQQEQSDCEARDEEDRAEKENIEPRSVPANAWHRELACDSASLEGRVPYCLYWRRTAVPIWGDSGNQESFLTRVSQEQQQTNSTQPVKYPFKSGRKLSRKAEPLS
ncbi:hypothetical protein CALCODRAFT_498259 [Calocera cornea HHB12733]|uniref:Uncharacterized protein n=1 Tax=Calocera cornea HHB12733 TaxID=1353952 RepID=A0A165EWJ4_9BASI|nr:hypothetical protein CALCODRAFT_498259 [Calocera cornea HHB12733]